MDASVNSHHGLHTVYSTADAMGDTPETIRSNVSQAEALAVVQHLLGLRVVTDLAGTQADLINRVVNRIFSVIDESRSSIDRAGLRTTLNTNLGRAIRQIRPDLDFDTANQNQKVQAVAQAAYESIPSDITYQLGVRSAPVSIAVENGQNTSTVEIPGVLVNGVAQNLQINMNHPFWRADTFRNQSDIQKAMRALTPGEIGITNFSLRNHRLSTAEITRITNAQFDVISVPSVNIADTEAIALRVGTATTDTNLNVKMNVLLKARTTDDAPRGLQNRYISELNPTQIRDLFLHRGAAGDFPYWKQFVECGANGSTDLVTACPALPLYVGYTLADVAMNRILRAPPGYTPIARVGTRTIRLLDAHSDVRAEQTKLEGLMTRLTTGSENELGAAVALSLATSNRAVLDAATKQGEETKIQTELNKSRARITLAQELKKLSELKLNLRITNLPSGVPATFLNIAAERNAIRSDLGAIGSPVAWTSDFCLTGGFPLPPTYLTPADRRDIASRIQPQLKEVSEELARYEEIEQILRRIAQAAVTSETFNSTSRLSTLISNAGVVDRAQIGAALNNVEVAEAIKNEIKLESESEIEASIKTNEELLKKAKTGGPSGDAFQQRIFEEHFKKQGLSAAESQKAGNYLYSRSLMDGELQGQQEALIQDMFADHREDGMLDDLENAYKEARPNRVILRLLHLLHVPTVDRLHNDEGIGPEWRTASYPTLVTAYFSLKKLYDGGGSAYINCVGSEIMKTNMRRIARILARRHVNMLVTDFGNDLSEDDRKKIASRKALSLETIEKILLGEAPAKYGPRVSQILGLLDERVDWKRRKLGRAAVKTGHVGWTAAKWTGEKTKNGVKKTWGQRRNLAAFAACSALAGPLGAAGWLAWKALKSDKSASAPSASHHT